MSTNYIIVTLEKFRNSIDGLVESKINKGYNVIWIFCDGHTDPDYIRNKILAKVGNSNQKDYLLIVGDYDDIPAYPLTHSGQNIRSDNYYSMKNDNDIIPRLLTGRLSSNNPVIIESICELILNYPENQEIDWQGRLIMAGWLPRGIEDSEPDSDIDAGWNTVHEIGEYYEIIKKFEYKTGEDANRQKVWEVSPNTRKADLSQAIEEGALIVRYHGHGSSYYWDNIGFNENYTRSDISSLNLNGKTPLVLSIACLTGDIGLNQSFAEEWLIQLKAVGVFASDKSVLTFWMDRIGQRIMNRIVSGGDRRVGKLLNWAMQKLYDDYKDQNINEVYIKSLKWMPRMYRYLGDPDTILSFVPKHSAGSVVSWGEKRLDIFTLASSGNLMHQWSHNGWGRWENLGGDLLNFNWISPAAVSWSQGRLDVFALGKNRDLKHLWYHEHHGGWGQWEDLEGELSNIPTVVSWEKGRLDIFARGTNNHLMHLWFHENHGGWGHWEDLGGDLKSSDMTLKISVCSWEPGRLDIFIRGKDSKLKHLWFHEHHGGWGQWEDLAGELKSDPDVVCWGPGRLDIFAQGKSNHLMHLWFHEGQGGWGNWEDLGGELKSRPSVATWQAGRLDIFSKGNNNHLMHLWFHEHHGGWGQWEDLKGTVTSVPEVVSWAPDRLDIFCRSRMSHLHHLWYENSWGKWEDKTTNNS